MNKAQLWSAAERYRRIRQKIDPVVDFYKTLDPIYTERYFRSLVSPSTPTSERHLDQSVGLQERSISMIAS